MAYTCECDQCKTTANLVEHDCLPETWVGIHVSSGDHSLDAEYCGDCYQKMGVTLQKTGLDAMFLQPTAPVGS